MNAWQNIRYMFGRRFCWSAGQFLITMIATVAFNLAIAVMLGVLFSLLYFLMKMSNIEVSVCEIEESRMGCEINLPSDVKVMYVTGPIFFGSLNCLMKEMESQSTGTLILSMRGVSLVDSSGVQAIMEFYEKNQQNGNRLVFASLQKDVQRIFRKAGVLEMAGEKAFFETAKDAIIYLNSQNNQSNQNNKGNAE
jgi:Sulfate permease and related transporters (MFS superfamily)